MLDLIVWGFWFIFGAYSFWYFTKAETLQPLNLDDLALTWKIHKNLTGCDASYIHSLVTKRNRIVGFKCACGFEFLQKRLITTRVPIQMRSGAISLTSTKRKTPFHQNGECLEELGIQYRDVKKI